MLSPFRAKTSRNQPSTTGFIFGLSKCSRQLIQPTPGNALAYIDWAQQEFGIAGALSEDTAMMDAYRTGDPYLAFAKQSGAVPEDATKETHAATREQYKQCALGVQYGMGAQSLAERLGISVADARVLLAIHRQTYRKFWKWSDAALDYAHLYGELYTVFGWRIQVMPDTTERTLRNFPVQSNAAEMLRLACCMLTEQGIQVCAPIHDAVLIEAPIADIKEVTASAESIMAEASAVVLGGFTLNSDRMYITETTPWKDASGKELWDKLIRRLPATVSEVGCHE
jgi:DNA polymerase I